MDINSGTPDLDVTLRKAFSYWSRTLMYQVLFSLTYFSIFFMIWYSLAVRYELLDDMMQIVSNSGSNFKVIQAEMQKLAEKPEYYNLSLGTLLTMAFLYPLNIGFFQIYRKIDKKEEFSISDLFSGYNGANFFKFASFFMFWIVVYQFAMMTVVLGVLWVFATLFVPALMFFRNIRIFEGIQLTFQAIKKNFLEVFVCVLVAVIFRYAGILIFFFGILFTFPFWNAVIYTLYQKIFGEKGEVTAKIA